MPNGFGPSTFGVQQMIQALLQGQNPSPLAPVPLAPTGGIGPLSLETTAALAALQPQPVPPALPGPIDADAIRARFGALAGPEPVAPVAGPDPLILKIARALQGFGAGVQGQGPQFLAQLQEQRERPQREFRAQKERFETRRQELGVMGEQAVMSAEERRAGKIQGLLDRQFEREYEQGVRRLNLKDQREQDLFRDALLAKRQREEDERQAEENRKKEAQQTKIELAKLASKYRAAGAKGDLATELAQKDLDPNFKLSRAAEKWFSARVALDEARAARAAGGGVRQPGVMVEVVNDNGSLSVVPLTEQVNSQINAGMVEKGPRGIFMEGQPAAAPPALPSIMRPDFVPGQDSIFGGLPAPAPTRAPSQPAQDRPWTTRARVEAEAKKRGIPYAVLEADIRSRNVEVR